MGHDIETLTLVFTIRSVHDVFEADHIVTEEEEAALEELFPAADLRARGLLDDKGRFTQAFEHAYADALAQLKHDLSDAEKRAILERCHRLCHADGRFHLNEQRALKTIAGYLGVAP